MKNFNELSGLELDTLREIGSIGTGNAATALSSLLQCEVRIEMPEVRILGYNEAIDWIGGPEVITAGVLVRLGGEINGIMLSVQQMDFINQVLGRMMNRTVCEYGQLSELDRSALVEVGNIMISTFVNGIMLSVQQMDFINQVLGRMMNRTVCEYGQLSELDRSALVEVGNIMISTFVNALSGLAGVTIQPSVPGFAVDMQGAIITVPMAEFGGQSDYIMTIGTNFICEKHSVPCRLLLSPDVRSLNFLLRKLGVLDE